MESKLKLGEKNISRLHVVIDFEKEPKIREKAFEIEKRVKDIFPMPVSVAPISDEEQEDTIRFVLSGPNCKCLFSQIRFNYIVDIDEDRGKNIEAMYAEIERNTSRVFSVLKEVIGKNIKRMGIICNLTVPLQEGESAINYVLNTFFKFQVTLTGLAFQLAREIDDEFNLNIFVRAQKTVTESARDILFVTVDINDYLDQLKRNVSFYQTEEINRVFSFEKQYIKETLNDILENRFKLES